MGKKLAIRGHSTRGKEVIELLEMLGGKNIHNYDGTFNECYAIDNNKICTIYTSVAKIDGYVIFTLEEFLEKYPFKIGDKVDVCETGKVFTIGNMIWEDEFYIVHYVNMEDFEYYTAKELKLYKKTNMNENKFGTAINPVESKSNAVGLKDDKINIDDNAIFSFNHTMRPEVNADGMLCYKIPDGYESFSIQEGMIILKPKKPTYPKTIIEVLDYWYPNREPEDNYQYIYKKELIKSFQLLLYCRDAYWKIAGEQMGLDKPWEPEYISLEDNIYFTIQTFNGGIDKSATSHRNSILAFPTIEMRDAFYENFKDLIEQCKELL